MSTVPTVLIVDDDNATCQLLAEVLERARELIGFEHAAIMLLAYQLGEPIPIAQEDIDSLYDRYQNVYGQ